MAAVQIEGDWTIRQLSERDRARVIAFLERDALQNVFLISKITDDGLGQLTPFIEILRDGLTVLVAAVGSNVVLACDPAGDAQARETALALLAESIITGYNPVRAIIAEAQLVERLWSRMASRVDPPTVVRLRQPVYVLDTLNSGLSDLRQTRYAVSADLDLLVPACAAMHQEEVGIDPLSRDSVAYRQRIRELIAKRRAVVRIVDRRIAFKCEYSAVTRDIVQLMGVWTAPLFRRRGYAREGMAEVCGHLLRQNKAVTLFVNDFNAPARALYESLGFRQIGANRALIW